MSLIRLSYAVAIAATLLVASGCKTDDPTDKTLSCTQDADCDPGSYCGADDKCTQDCDPASPDAACPTGESCDSNGRCVVSGECVSDDDCDTPPSEASCEGDTLVAYSEEGLCVAENDESSCEYTETRTQCENGCAGGFCLEDPCSAISCDAPPAPVCDTDDVTLITFSDPGTCSEGACEYGEVRQSCAVGCAGGECQTGTCETEMCDNPPADTCDGDTAVTYAPTGTCMDDNGTPLCDYMPLFETCTYLGPDATCSGAQCEGAAAQSGEILIREYMANPAGSFNDIAEWFEVVNTTGATIDLDGWTIRSGGVAGDEEHTIAGSVPVDAGAAAVMVRTDSVNFAFAYEYGGISLANNTDWLLLEDVDGNLVDYVFYEPGSILAGRSRKLDPVATQDVTANDDFANWCPSMTDEFLATPPNYGTPGADNTGCAADPCNGFTCEPPTGFCLDGENKAVQYGGANVMCEQSRFNNPFCDFETMEVQCTDGTELCALGDCQTLPSNLPGVGDVIISEFMPNPDGTDTDREWVEVYNTTGAELSLFSVVFRNESGANAAEYQFLDPALTVAANGYIVFARDIDPAVNGGVMNAFNYSGGNLVNGATGPGLLSLNLADGTVIDAAYYDNPSDGASYQLDVDTLDATSNDDAANWCAGVGSYGDGGEGTPGTANVSCN